MLRRTHKLPTRSAHAKKASGKTSTPFTRKLCELYTRATFVGTDEDADDRGVASRVGIASCDEGSAPAVDCDSEAARILCVVEDNAKCSISIVGVGLKAGEVVHDSFVDSSGDRAQLVTRLQHLRPCEIILPHPSTPTSLSKATEDAIERCVPAVAQATSDSRQRLPY